MSRLASVLCVALFLLCASATPSHAITISLVADRASVTSGERVVIDIVAADFAAGEFVSAFDFTLSFDPALLSYMSGSFGVGTALGDTDGVDFLDFSDFSAAAGGDVFPFVLSLLDDGSLAARQPGPSVVLASLAFMAERVAAAASASVTPTCASVSGPLGPDGNAVLLNVSQCSVATVGIMPPSTVPTPGTLMLLAIGLLGIASTRSSRRMRREHLR